MTEIHLMIIVGLILALCILGVWWYDNLLVKRIDEYEKRLEEKGILKRHFSKRRS